METEQALSGRAADLSRQLRLVAARERGVAGEHLRWIGTDPDLFELFYREHVEDLQRFVARRVGQRDRAADLTAEIFLATVESAHRYRPGRGTPKAWLYGIARIVVADDRRRHARDRDRAERLRGSTLLDAHDAARIDARIDAAARSRQLYAAMEGLPEGERAVLELVAIDELTLGEAAAAVGVRPVTARVRLHRARRKMRAELETAKEQSASEEARS